MQNNYLLNLQFYKYQGTGNDFVMVNNLTNEFSLTQSQIAFICNRRFGVGADGLMFLQKTAEDYYEMVYYNSDGNMSSMCGNGGRCFVQFLFDLGMIDNKVEFVAIDGWHDGEIIGDEVRLKMSDVIDIKIENEYAFLDTGSPHYVTFCENIAGLDVKQKGAEIRYSNQYNEKGTNVNFVETSSIDPVKMRTYERGVEDETLSCGTGVTAVAIAMHKMNKVQSNKVEIQTEGGQLKVEFKPTELGYSDIYLSGPAKRVFTGYIEV